MKNNYYRFLAFSLGSIAGTACLFSTAKSASALTFVLDFNDLAQANTSDSFPEPYTVRTFDVDAYGFSTSDFSLVTNSILNTVESHFYDIPDISEDVRSSIPAGEQLDIDFEIGNIGTLPINGDSEYYYIQIGDYVSGPGSGSLGVAGLGAARQSDGTLPHDDDGYIGLTLGSVFTDNINRLSLLTPSNALTSGNLEFTTNAIAGTLSHEIAHTLSLLHINKTGAETPNGLPPIMGTGAVDLPNQDRIGDREFSFSGVNSQVEDEAELEPILRPITDLYGLQPSHGDEAEGFSFGSIPLEAQPQSHVQQLVNAVGTRDTVAVPFEFSPGMGLFVVGSTWGFATWRKRK